jgi:hypothetical protein
MIVWTRLTQTQVVSEDKFTVGGKTGRMYLVGLAGNWNVWFNTGPGEVSVIAEGIDRMSDAQQIACEFVA